LTDFSKTLLILDGPSDIKAMKGKLQKEFSNCPQFRKAPCNGHTVTVEGYVNGIFGIINLALNQKYLNIFCVLDREKRQISATNLAKKIHNKLIQKIDSSTKISKIELNEKIKIVAADRMLENWIIADLEGIKKRKNLININSQQELFDGKSGVKLLKQFMIVNYNKVQHAELLFKAVSIERAIKYSPSFNKFILMIESVKSNN